MPAAWATLAWYGPGAVAAISPGDGDPPAENTAQMKARARPSSTITAIASVPLAKPTRLVNRPATIIGTGSVATALPKGRARPTSTIKVNSLSQDDVTGAVLEAEVLPGLTLRQALVDARKAAKLAAALSA